MSIETIKILTGFGKPLRNKMLSYDTFNMSFRKLSVHRDGCCAVCG